MIIMDSKAQLTVDIMAKVAERKITIINAAKLLNKSRRTIERYLKKYQKVGIQFVVHQNSGRPPVNKTSDAVKRAVQALIKEKYFDVNLAHLRELLEDNEQIQVKRETLRSWAHEIHHVKRAKRRRTQARKRRERMESPGLLLQMDGSPHRWFGKLGYRILPDGAYVDLDDVDRPPTNRLFSGTGRDNDPPDLPQ